MIRWKKRLKCWAMFNGTSRRASAWVTRSGSTVLAKLADGKAWLQAPSIAEAKAWCESTPAHRWPHVIEEMIAIVVLPDGQVERRAVERTASICMHWRHQMVRTEWADPLREPTRWMPIEQVVLHGRVFALSHADPMTGDYIQWRIMAYATPQYEGVADVYAKEALQELRDNFRRNRARTRSKSYVVGLDEFNRHFQR